jgi:hypothetical protein
MPDRWIRDDDVIATDLDDELVLLNPATRAVYTVNGTGRAVWNRLTDPASVAELAAALVTAFDVDDTTAARDVAELIDDLAAAGLVRVA